MPVDTGSLFLSAQFSNYFGNNKHQKLCFVTCFEITPIFRNFGIVFAYNLLRGFSLAANDSDKYRLTDYTHYYIYEEKR